MAAVFPPGAWSPKSAAVFPSTTGWAVFPPSSPSFLSAILLETSGFILEENTNKVLLEV